MPEPAAQDRLTLYQRNAAKFVAALLGLVLLALVGRLVQINTAQAAKLAAMGEEQYYGRLVLPARRGTIFDVRGRVVAGSRQLYGVFADPAGIEDLERTAVQVATILGSEAGAVEDRIRHSGSARFCWIEHHVSPVEADAIRKARLPGISLVDESVRHYPLGSSMGQVIGFAGGDGVGLEGLELQCNDWLVGQDGYAWTVRDTRRRPLQASSEPDHDLKEPRDGGHVVLTLDSVIQGFLETRLARQVQDFDAEGGVGVVMDPKTGDVLAMANYPPFDPGDLRTCPPEVRRNRTVTDPVEPGSTFKPFVAAGALQKGVVSRGQVINCQNGVYVTGHRCLHDAHPHGDLTFEEIVAKSSNIGMAILGERLGDTALYEILRRFGFGQPTGIDFPGEAAGCVLPLPEWTSYSKTSIPMGHEINVTPIQLISGLCAIANDGVLLRPRLIRACLAPDGEVVQEFSGPDPLWRALPVETARYFTREVLVGVVSSKGSGSRAAVDGYKVFGKTGTAQLTWKNRRGYEPNAYLASFMGGAPADDPRVAVLVMIRRPNPRKGYYGGIVSAPVVADVLAATLAYLEVPRDDGAVVAAR